MDKVRDDGSDIITPKRKGDKKMPVIRCPKCGENRTQSIILRCDNCAMIRGIVTCLYCGHELPVTITDDHIEEISQSLPGIQSDQLNSSVPDDIQEDVEEAERANYAQCYKACVVMCRRAVQLGLIDKGISDGPFGGMLAKAKGALLSDDLYNLATSIKGFGDIEAHRREELEPREVNMVVYATVRMLNEIFP